MSDEPIETEAGDSSPAPATRTKLDGKAIILLLTVFGGLVLLVAMNMK